MQHFIGGRREHVGSYESLKRKKEKDSFFPLWLLLYIRLPFEKKMERKKEKGKKKH